MLEQLNDWNPSPAALNSVEPLCACIEEIWIMLFESGYIEIGDVHLVQAWIASLLTVGYQFPKLLSELEKVEKVPTPSKSEEPTVLLNSTNKESRK